MGPDLKKDEEILMNQIREREDAKRQEAEAREREAESGHLDEHPQHFECSTQRGQGSVTGNPHRATKPHRTAQRYTAIAVASYQPHSTHRASKLASSA